MKGKDSTKSTDWDWLSWLLADPYSVYALKNLEINFVSVCNEGANQRAKILLTKERKMADETKVLDQKTQKTSEENLTVQVNMKEFSEQLNKSLTEALSPLLKKEEVAPETIVDTVVALTSAEVNKMAEGLKTDFSKQLTLIKEEVAKQTPPFRKDAEEEAITLEGKVFKKSEVGDSVFSFISSMYTANLKLQKEIHLKDLTAMVEKEYPNVVGTPLEKAMFFEYLEKAEDGVKQTGLALLKALNTNAEKYTRELGHNGNGSGGSDVEHFASDNDYSLKLDKMAEEYAQKEGVTKAIAYQKVLETPEGDRLYTAHLAAIR